MRIVASGESLVFPALTRRLVERHATRVDAGDRRALLLAAARPTARPRRWAGWSRAGGRTRRSPTSSSVAVHTVKTHVARVLAKLEVRDRTQAVVLAYETGFVQPGE